MSRRREEQSSFASIPRSFRLKPDDRPGVESDYIRDGNLTLTGVGPSFLMKKKVIDKTLTLFSALIFLSIGRIFESRPVIIGLFQLSCPPLLCAPSRIA